MRRTLTGVEPGVAEALVFQARPPADPAMLEGDFYAALEINFPGTRMWAQTFVTQGRIKSTVK